MKLVKATRAREEKREGSEKKNDRKMFVYNKWSSVCVCGGG